MAVLQVIKFNGLRSRDWLVFRYPDENFVLGSQLIVAEGQIAVFFKGGQAADVFGPGTHTLSTKNIPILAGLINLPFGRQTPFPAEIYYINRTAKLDVLWGTTDPISLIDPKYSVRMRVRAHGQMGFQINDFRLFLTELIGALGYGNVVKFDAVKQFYRGMIVTKVKTLISDYIIYRKISVLELSPLLEDISTEIKYRIQSDFDRYGIQMLNFYITSINHPDEDIEIINKILGEKAAFDIIGDSRYNVKRSFDVLDAAASNEGNGGFAAAGLGLGIGTGAGLSLGNVLGNQSMQASPVLDSVKCSECHYENPAHAKFCANCGHKQAKLLVICPQCEASVPEGSKFCSTCGTNLTKKNCSNCQAELEHSAMFCQQCGTKSEGST